jgi:hypothetical protein
MQFPKTLRSLKRRALTNPLPFSSPCPKESESEKPLKPLLSGYLSTSELQQPQACNKSLKREANAARYIYLIKKNPPHHLP